MLTTAIRRSLSSGSRIKSTPSYLISFRSISTQPSLQRLCFPHSLSTLEFPTIILYQFLISPLCTTYHTHHIFLDFIGLMFGKEKFTNCKVSLRKCLCSFFSLTSLSFPSLRTYKQQSTNSNMKNKRKHIRLQYRNQFFRVVTKSKKTSKSPTMNKQTNTQTFMLHSHCYQR